MVVYLFRIFKSFQDSILPVPGRVIVFLTLIFLFVLPLLTESYYLFSVIIFTCIYAIFAASWDLLSGYTGQMNLGHAAFFGIGAYGAAMLNLYLGWPPWASIPAGAFIATGGGLIICMPALKLRGLYLALVTLGFPVVLTGIVFITPEFTGGELGISGLSPLTKSIVSDYYLSLIVAFICLGIMWKLSDSKSKYIRTGVILYAIREDEVTARATGINTPRYKMLVFSISAFFAGVSGGFYAHFIKVAGPSTLELFNSINPIVWTVFGGMTTIYGPVTGVFILYPLMELLRVVQEVRILLFTVVVICILLFMPEGIAVWVRDKLEEECPRCKEINIRVRKLCRVCDAPLHLDRK